MAQHRAALLRHADLVEHGDTFAFEMRRHAEQRADRHHTGAADTGNQHAIRLAECGQCGVGQGREPVFADISRSAFLHAAALDRHKTRAEAFEAGEILVAARLVDHALAAEFGLNRRHRQAVRLRRAVAAALADEVVDDYPLWRIGETAALAAAALLGGAGLVIDDRRNALELADFALDVVELVAVPHGRAGWEIGAGRVFL